MLTLDEIKKHWTPGEQRFPQFVLKEYLQCKILDIVFSSKYGNQLAFMGGTAVRLVYGNDRFSEDLDLDNIGLSEEDFADLVSVVARELEEEGLLVEVRNTFKDVYHCYIKFPKILFHNKLSLMSDEKMLIRLDSFHTQDVRLAQPYVLSKADVFSEIRVYPAPVLLSQKIAALLGRKRSKGRDIYDVVYLFSFTDPDYRYLSASVGIDGECALLEAMRKRFSAKEIAALAQDVRPFLLDAKKVARVEKFHLWLEGRMSQVGCVSEH